MMKPLALLFVVVVACSCSPGAADTTIDTVFDPCAPVGVEAGELTRDQRASVNRALTMWNETARTSLTIAADDDVDLPTIPVHFQKAAAAFHGVYDDEAGVVYVNDAIDNDHQRAVTVAHELGHAFGLLHIDVKQDASVMNDGNLKTEPNDFDVDALAELWGRCSI
jgi:hypothetical protein